MDWLKLKETYVHLESLLHMLAGIQHLQHRHANICCWLALCGIVKKIFFACRSGGGGCTACYCGSLLLVLLALRAVTGTGYLVS
jgi:hypothetical protein